MTSIRITTTEIEFDEDTKIDTVTTDIGVILLYAGPNVNNISNNFLLCDGSSYSRDDYIELFSVIGTNYGSDSDTTFNVPNFKQHLPIGPTDNNTNIISYRGISRKTGGNNMIESSQFKHSHVIPNDYAATNTNNYIDGTNNNSDKRWFILDYNRQKSITTSNIHDDSGVAISEGNEKEHFPEYTVLNYIICYKT